MPWHFMYHVILWDWKFYSNTLWLLLPKENFTIIRKRGKLKWRQQKEMEEMVFHRAAANKTSIQELVKS